MLTVLTCPRAREGMLYGNSSRPFVSSRIRELELHTSLESAHIGEQLCCMVIGSNAET